mmetsp:Transcript_25340/g.59312  ORF Transcript_25340/g.59312 Transcript_25340/m.59312 type:complete len:308 (-) Transcript_25340:183-1106(-)
MFCVVEIFATETDLRQPVVLVLGAAGFAPAVVQILSLGGVQRQQLLEGRSPRDAGSISREDLVPPLQEPVHGGDPVDPPDPSQADLVVGHLEDRYALVHGPVVLDGVDGGHPRRVIDPAVRRVGRVVIVLEVRQLQPGTVGSVQTDVPGNQPVHLELAHVALGIVQDVDLLRKQPSVDVVVVVILRGGLAAGGRFRCDRREKATRPRRGGVGGGPRRRRRKRRPVVAVGGTGSRRGKRVRDDDPDSPRSRSRRRCDRRCRENRHHRRRQHRDQSSRRIRGGGAAFAVVVAGSGKHAEFREASIDRLY